MTTTTPASVTSAISAIGFTGPGVFVGDLTCLYFYNAAYSSTTDACVATQVGVA